MLKEISPQVGNSPSKLVADVWIYPIYMTVACLFTAGLNIVHTKYILQISPRMELFIVPLAAGAIFGYLTARIRLANAFGEESSDWMIYSKYILFSCLVTSSLNVVHTDWVLHKELSLDLFAAPIIAGVFFGYLLARIKTLNKKLLRLATTDIMTELCNRMHFDNQLNRQIQHIKRHGGTFSIIYIDVDNFKQINDRYGHHVGDKVLVRLADHIRGQRKSKDIIARYGGDEFIILSPGTNRNDAEIMAERLKNSILELSNDGIPAVSCSFGVVEYGSTLSNTHNLLLTVDKALYKAKNLGRNSVATA